MANVTYPIPYEFFGSTLRMVNSKWIQISDEVELKIREIESQQTQVVASGYFSWQTQGIPGQGTYNEDQDRKRLNPVVDIRQFEGKMYVPLRCYNRNDGFSKAATPEDVKRSVGSFDYTLAHAFDRLYNKEARNSDMLYGKHHHGKLKTLEDAKLQPGSEMEALKKRDAAIEDAKTDISKYLMIDGELWRQLAHEPIVVVKMSNNIVDIKIQASDPDTTEKVHFFALPQMEECKEFVEKTWPGLRIRQTFEDPSVHVPEAFAFSAEAVAILQIARRVERVLLRDSAWIEGEFEAAYRQLHTVIFDRPNATTEDFVSALRNLDAKWDNEGLIKSARPIQNDVQMALERWDLRPIVGRQIAM